MPAARYWRLVGIETAGGGDLELSEIALYSGASRIDGAATLTSSHAPVAGALVDLKDGSTSTACRFAAADVRSAGFYLQWDFGGPVDITELRLGASIAPSTFVSALSIEKRDSGAWGLVSGVRGIIYPGPSALTTTVTSADTQFWSAVDKYPSVTLSAGGRSAGSDSPFIYQNVRGANSKSAGRWYWELFIDAASSPNVVVGCGIANALASLGGTAQDYMGGDAHGIAVYSNDGAAYRSSLSVGTGDRPRFASGDVIGLALDLDLRALQLYKNNLATLTIASLPAGPIFPAASLYGGAKVTALYGSDLVYSPPSGYDGNYTPTTMGLPETTNPLVHMSRARTLVAASSAATAHRMGAVAGVQTARDVEHGGPGTIYGTTKTKGTPNLPTKARVVLLHQRSKLPVRETWSDPTTGYFEFRGIDTNQQFLALAEDAEGHFRPVVANRLTPEVTP